MKKRESSEGQRRRSTGKETLRVRNTESPFDQIDKMHERIMQRAHDMFLGNGGILGRDLENWLSAERELVWKPAIELREKGNQFLLTTVRPRGARFTHARTVKIRRTKAKSYALPATNLPH